MRSESLPHWWHEFTGIKFKAARILIDQPSEWGDCTPGVHNWFTDAFYHTSPEELDQMDAGDVARHLLHHRLQYLYNLKEK